MSGREPESDAPISFLLGEQPFFPLLIVCHASPAPRVLCVAMLVVQLLDNPKDSRRGCEDDINDIPALEICENGDNARMLSSSRMLDM